MAAVAISLGTWTAALGGNIGPWKALLGGGLLGLGLSFIGRSRLRQQEERKRDDISRGTGTAIWALIDEVRFSSSITKSQALARFDDIGVQYHNAISSLADSKTRRHAELQWTNDFLPLRNLVAQAADDSERRANIKSRQSAVFAGGGFSATTQLVRVRPGEGIRWPGRDEVSVVPGADLGYDSQYMTVPRGTQIYTQSEMRNTKGYQTGSSGVGMEGGKRPLDVSVVLEEDDDGRMWARVSGAEFEERVVAVIRKRKKRKGQV